MARAWAWSRNWSRCAMAATRLRWKPARGTAGIIRVPTPRTHVYSTCLFCNQPLGANAAIDKFPIGRRLAFDPAKGRLWVVCRKCERWNLSPLDERWEAIEQADRLYTDARRRVATDQIGLARLS